ncbi:DUF3090 domain-containing protein [Brachybacterium saurashtrense]|uniref:DUF3090 domain-containing protein n=1 Tax=Brachybacterium saurashtrense TaxID=556288 RepID=A0A345YP54_9MICO|nr:DUF3090 domain-containing protein [Brachybacterium saurashtrense]AXK45706.1 DUF3090 domain-containing protein [Brachybacterium saurashtrense]RRR24724.1 DUF3090 domain-containing protein [Brachybacterium saurashtrense]
MTDVPAHVHEFDWPDRVVIGTIGRPGARTFYLQARTGAEIVSVALEKEQSALLAQKVDEMLDQLRAVEGNRYSVPDGTPDELVDDDPLDPVQEQFRAGTLGIGWDPTTAQVILEAQPLPADDDVTEADAPALSEMLRVRMPVGTARAFTRRTREIVDAGRPLCSLCGHPIDPDGHTCILPEL